MKKPYAVFYIDSEINNVSGSLEDCIDHILASVQVKCFKRYSEALDFFNDERESCAFRIMDKREFGINKENIYIDARPFCQLEILKPFFDRITSL